MAQRYSVPLVTGTPLIVWELGPTVASSFSGQPAPGQDHVMYQFKNGHVDTGDLPGRKAFRHEMTGRPISLPDYWSSAGLYVPVANRRVEFNSFEYTPTHKRRWCRTVLTASAAGDHKFSLATCGGVRIWVNGKEVCRFEPFERNSERRTETCLPLKAGDNSVWLHMEDLFERDTNWYFELTYRGQNALVAGIDVEARANHIEMVRALAAGVRPLSDFFNSEPFVLLFDQAPDFDIPVSVRIFSRQHDRTTFLNTEVQLKRGHTHLEICPSEAIPDGYHGVALTFKTGDVVVDRVVDAVFFSRLAMPPAPGTEMARKREALEFASRHGDPRIGRVLAMFATDNIDAAATFAILDATLRAIETREDCSDFVMVPLLWIWGRYADRLPASLKPRIRRAIVEWRYWVDEPGNDVMWFWSENHVLCFHVTQYIAGDLFPDTIFACSGRSGKEQRRLAESRLHQWFDAVEEHGFVEWNSAAYYPIDFIGIFGLYAWCGGALKARCKALLDKLFMMIGLHTLAGVPAGSMGRAYDKELRAGPLTELAPFCRIGFGEGWLTPGVAALPLYCLADYTPPPQSKAAALWAEDVGLQARYTQGHDHNGKLVLFKSRAAMLSTVVEHSAGARGSQQHVVDVRLSGHPMARLWINHPGEDDPWGVKRPSYWSGNGILPLVGQVEDTALLVYDLGTQPERAFVHAFAARDGLDAIEVDGHWLFARSGDGYAAIWSSERLAVASSGATAGREFSSQALRSGWMVRVGSGRGATDFAGFIAATMARQPVFDADARRIELNHARLGSLTLDWNAGLSRNGLLANFTAMTVNPIVQWGADTPPLSVGG